MKTYNLFLFIMMFAFSNFGKAADVAGGELSISQIDDSTFFLNFRLYKYCAGASHPPKIDSSISSSLARIHENGTNNLIKVFSSSSFDSVVSIPSGDACYSLPGLCLEVVYYSASVVLQPSIYGYYATWKLCSKKTEGNYQGVNDYIFYAQISNPLIADGNSTPKFKALDKSDYMCIGYEKKLDFSCGDKDGDSLVYSLITPYNGFSISGSKPFVNSNYTTSFSLDKLLGPGSICKIDSSTGIITARPAQLGIFSISVMCEEYRDGNKLGEVTKTVVFSSLACNNFSQFNFENIPINYEFKIGESNCFDLVASSNYWSDLYLNFSSNVFNLGAKVSLPDSNNNGNYDFEWSDRNIEIIDTAKNIKVTQTASTQFYSTKERIGARFCWDVNDCEIYGKEKHFLDVQAVSDLCGIIDTIFIRLELNIEGMDPSINTPNSFSPNGDGIEDVFRVKKNIDNECLTITKTKIYSINGQLIFETTDPNFFWNGKDMLDKDVNGGIYYVVYEGIYGETPKAESFKLLLYR